MQDGSTCYDISEYYPLLDEIYDNSKPDSEPWTPKWLIKEHLVALVSRPANNQRTIPSVSSPSVTSRTALLLGSRACPSQRRVDMGMDPGHDRRACHLGLPLSRCVRDLMIDLPQPHSESIRGDLQVILHPASRAPAKHGSWKDLLRTIHAIWAVPYTPQAIAALQRHGQRLAPEVIVLPPIAGLQRRA